MSSPLAAVFRWLQRKRYQYEVTFSLYMLTPTEKFIFNMRALSYTDSDSFIFLFFSMILIACSLYLPHHIAFLITRAYFYWQGDAVTAENPALVDAAIDTVIQGGKSAMSASMTSAGQRFKEAVETAMANKAEL